MAQWKRGLSHTAVKGFVWQLEQGSTRHIQGYVELKHPVTWKALRSWWPGAHLEMAKGNRQQNVRYCSKTNTRVKDTSVAFSSADFLTQASQGRRSDLDKASSAVLAGKTMREIALSTPKTFVQAYRGLAALRAIAIPPRSRSKVTTIHLWGRTGLAKTHGTIQFLELDGPKLTTEQYFIWSPKGGANWWDGYDGQDWVLIDDLDAGKIPMVELLRILDTKGLPYKVPVHGGQVNLVAHNFIVTSNKSIDELYPLAQKGVVGCSLEQQDALKRRMTHTWPLRVRDAIGALPYDAREAATSSWLKKMFGGDADSDEE